LFTWILGVGVERRVEFDRGHGVWIEDWGGGRGRGRAERRYWDIRSYVF
jgi:hypothetical protein